MNIVNFFKGKAKVDGKEEEVIGHSSQGMKVGEIMHIVADEFVTLDVSDAYMEELNDDLANRPSGYAQKILEILKKCKRTFRRN